MNKRKLLLLTEIKFLLNATNTSINPDYSFPLETIKNRVFHCVSKSGDIVTNCRLIDAYITLATMQKKISKIIYKNIYEWKSISLGKDIFKIGESELSQIFFTFSNVFTDLDDEFTAIFTIDGEMYHEVYNLSGNCCYVEDGDGYCLKVKGNKCFIQNSYGEDVCSLQIGFGDIIIFERGYLDLDVVLDENGIFKIYRGSYVDSLDIDEEPLDEELLACIHWHKIELNTKPYEVVQLLPLQNAEYNQIYILIALAIAYIQRNRIKTHNKLLIWSAVLFGLAGTSLNVNTINVNKIK